MLIRTPRAPWMDVSSSSGLAIAFWAASTARCSPRPIPVPMSAMPIPDMIVRTSAKSRLMRPGTRMRSEMPCTACCRTESATLNASCSDVPFSTTVRSRWLGIVSSVSTIPRSSWMPASAWRMRRGPSNWNGFVTQATVSAPSSLAIAATTGAAPVPVPPPMPGRDEDHVGAGQGLLEELPVLARGAAADLGVGAGAEPAGELGAELDLDLGRRRAERLRVGVGHRERHAGEARADHPVHGVRPAASEPDDPDLRREFPILFLEPEDELLPHRRLSLFRPAFPDGRILLSLTASPPHQKISRSHSRTRRAVRPTPGQPSPSPGSRPAAVGGRSRRAPVRTSPTAVANPGFSTCS